MSGRKLTEPEAWREIARRIAEKEWLRLGLCAEVNELLWDWHITKETAFGMKRRALSACDIWAYELGTQPEGRILASLWFALEAEEEGA